MDYYRPYPQNLSYYPLDVLRARFFLEIMNPMQNEQLEILTAMIKIPGLKDLSIPVENIPDAAEFEALNDEFQADMEATFAAEWELGCVPGMNALAEVTRQHRAPEGASLSVAVAVADQALA